MKKNFLILLMLIFVFSTNANEKDDNTPAQIMLFGVFHFANPQADKVKTKQIDVMTPENQAYLDVLAKQITDYKPTAILLEYSKKHQTKFQQEYEDYLKNKLVLNSNEIHQLGFRIAKLTGLSVVHYYDEKDVQWQPKAMFEYMAKHDKEAQESLGKVISQLTREIEQSHMTKTLKELLLLSNSSEWDELNKSLYIKTNHVGAGDGFSGADAAASWWHRNFRMYANIQKHAQPGERVLVIGGQGHTAIFKDFLKLDTQRQAVDVKKYIK